MALGMKAPLIKRQFAKRCCRQLPQEFDSSPAQMGNLGGWKEKTAMISITRHKDVVAQAVTYTHD